MPALGEALRKGLAIIADEKPRLLLSRGVATVAGTTVGPSNAVRAAAVYAAVSLIAEPLASVPVHFLQRDDESRRRQQPGRVRALWEQPNADQSAVAFYETLIFSMLLWGNFYGFNRWTNGGELAEVWPINPERVTEIERLEGADGQLGLRFRVEDYRGPDGPWVTNRPGGGFPAMLHIPWVTMPGTIRGLSVIEAHAELIGMSLSSQEHAARFLGEAPALAGTIETDEDLDLDDAKDLVDGFLLRHAGPGKSGGVGVLAGGASFKPITVQPRELQFLEQMQYSDRKIASIFRVPPHMLGDTQLSTSWGSGLEEQVKGFVIYREIPVARKIEAAVERTFFRGTDLTMRFQLNALLRGSPRDRAEFYRVLWSLGAMNANQILAREDLPPIDDEHGERYYVPLNVRAADMPEEQLEERFRAAAALGLLGGAGIAPVAADAPAATVAA